MRYNQEERKNDNLQTKERDIMLEYKIEGGNLPVVICYPEAGQTIPEADLKRRLEESGFRQCLFPILPEHLIHIW